MTVVGCRLFMLYGPLIGRVFVKPLSARLNPPMTYHFSSEAALGEGAASAAALELLLA
jgi:hypothetical protein